MDGQARVSLILELKNKLKTALNQAKDHLNKNVQEMKGKLSELKETHVKAFSAMSNEMPGFGRGMDLLTNKYVFMTAAIVGIAAALSKASAAGQQFDSAMAKTNVTLQMNKGDLKKAGSDVLNIAKRSSLQDATTQAPEALNILASANLDDNPVKNYNLSLKALEPTLNAAKWGFTDVATVARAASLTMNASGVKDATKIYDVFAATLNKGNAEFSSIAQYLPKLVSQAKMAGIEFEQTAGAYAFMTQKFNAEKSATMLENIVKTLQDTDRVHAFKKLGVDVFDANHQMKTLVQISTDLNKAVGSLNPEMRAMALNSLNLDNEATAGFSAMMQNVEGLKSAIDVTTNSTGASAEALKNAKTPLDDWYRISNYIAGTWIEFGRTLNEIVVGPFATWLLNHKTLLEVIGYTVLTLVAAWALYNGTILIYNAYTSIAATVTGLLTSEFGLLNIVMNLNPVGLIVTAIGLLIGGFIAAYKNSEKFRAVLSGLMAVASLVADVFVGLGKTIAGAMTMDVSMIKAGMIQSATAVTDIINGGVKKKFNEAYDASMAESAKKVAEETTNKATANTTKNLYDKPNDKVQAVLDSEKKKLDKKDKQTSTTAGTSSKVININKLSVVDGNFISNNADIASKSSAEVMRLLEEMVSRALLNVTHNMSAH